MSFYFEELLELLSESNPNQSRVVDFTVLLEMKYNGLRIGFFKVEANTSLDEWRYKRGAILSSTVWGIEGMKPFCFQMTVGNNSNTILLPTAKSLLELTNLSAGQKYQAFMHETEFGNSPAIISLGTVLYNYDDCYDPQILFGRSLEGNEPVKSCLGPAAMDNRTCSDLEITVGNKLR